MTESSCQTCRFWKRSTRVVYTDYPAKEQEPAPWGDCRRHAPRGPTVFNEGPSGSVYGEVQPFVATSEGDWCGEYEQSADGSGTARALNEAPAQRVAA